MNKGLIHIYTGDGKGKTTAAMGLCLRAAGHGFHVGIAQFLKNGTSGELHTLSALNDVYIFSFLPEVKFTFAMNNQEKSEARVFYTRLLSEISLKANQFDLVLLDEVIPAVTSGLLDINSLLDFLNHRPEGLEVVLTGRNPPPELMNTADYVSEIKMVKHPYEKGIPAREGIEW